MLVVLEAFYDAQPHICDYDAFDVLQRFRVFVDQLGTCTVSITTSSIVYDMEASFRRMMSQIQHQTNPFAWEEPSIFHNLHEFVLTRECWKYAEGREPALEVTFGVTGGRRRGRHRHISQDLILHFHYGWYPPTVGFENLQNVVLESTDFVLKPTISAFRPFSEMPRLEIEYYLESTQASRNWLQWDDSTACFRGIMPYSIAPAVGAQRLDSYTLPLELTAKIIKPFPGNIRYETTMRCALPLTVKRQADECISRYLPMEPLPSPLKSMLRSIIPPPRSMNVQVRMVTDMTLDSGNKPDSSHQKHPWSPRFSRSRDSQPSTPHREVEKTSTVLKVNQHGDLDSDSDGGTPDPTPQAVSILLSLEKRSESSLRHDEFESMDWSPIRTDAGLGWRVVPSTSKGGNETPTRGPSARSFKTASVPPRLNLHSDKSRKPLSELQSHRNQTLKPQTDGCVRGSLPTRMQRASAHASGSESDKLTTNDVEVCFYMTRYNRSSTKCELALKKTAVDSMGESPTKRLETSGNEVAAWQREIQQNYQESLALKGEDVTMMEADAWSGN